MILEGYVKCSTCHNVQFEKIFLKTEDYLSENNSRELKWKCNKCGLFNFIEIKVKKVD